jgi:hypothetical protein
MPYVSTANKAAIRQLYDQPIIERWRHEIGRPLAYFGLPGPEICDFLEWGYLLAAERTAVESPGKNAVERRLASNAGRRMMSNVLANRMSSGFQLLRGDIEDIIIGVLDEKGTPPTRNNGAPVERARFSYDFVNLDFDGGLGYRDKSGKAKRIDAIKKLFERQEGTSFLLLLTLNVRHNLGKAIEQNLADLEKRYEHEELGKVLRWYLKRNRQDELLKVVVPTLVHAAAELWSFRVSCYPPITYVGHEHARMVHFAFELRAEAANLRSVSDQCERDLITLPLLTCDGGKLTLGGQFPGFQANQSVEVAPLLPEQVRLAILR